MFHDQFHSDPLALANMSIASWKWKPLTIPALASMLATRTLVCLHEENIFTQSCRSQRQPAFATQAVPFVLAFSYFKVN